jgi:hypothetical protein
LLPVSLASRGLLVVAAVFFSATGSRPVPALASAIFTFYLVFGILRSGYLVGYFSSARLVTLRGRLRVAVLDTAEQQPRLHL